ncbi:MAG: Crp/Fnr family transcriptional regulator [Spirochaetaceae bacterium]|nr:Crp/Fnr family transcriptional regulator [Spirochaetaceae bacterium]
MDANMYINQNKELLSYFSEFDNEDIQELEVVEYDSNTTILDNSNLTKNIFIIIKGICCVFKNLQNGKPFCYYKIANNDVIGLFNFVHSEEIDVYNKVITATKVIALKIPKEDFLKYKDLYPSFYTKVIIENVHRLHTALTVHVECKMYNSTINVVSYLIYSYKIFLKMFDSAYIGPVPISETRATISRFTGISIRSINNTIEFLKNLNYITITKGKVNIDKDQYLNLISYKLDNI